MANKLTNKPVTPGEEMLELLKEWTGPDVTEVKSAELKGKTNFLGVHSLLIVLEIYLCSHNCLFRIF